MLNKLISNIKPRTTKTFKTDLIHNSDYFDESRIIKANAFISAIFDVGFDVHVTKFSKKNFIVKNVLLIGSSIVSLISLAEIAGSLLHNQYPENGEFIRFVASSMIALLSYISNRDIFEINRFFNSTSSYVQNNQSIINGSPVASAYKNMNKIALAEPAHRTVCVIHELVHMLGPNGITKGNSDYYLATALELYYCSVMNFKLSEINPNFSNHYDLGKKLVDNYITKNTNLNKNDTIIISTHEGSIRAFSKGAKAFPEKPVGYITGFFVGGILARMHEIGIKKEVINAFIRSLAAGRDIQESLVNTIKN